MAAADGEHVQLDDLSTETKEQEEHLILDENFDEETASAVARGSWASKAEFILSLLGFAVGLANIWRFPYLCYRNGGGAFLVPYWIFMFLAGVPLFFMEVSIGQFTSRSSVSMWSIAPILKGAGYATVIVTVIVSIYYNVLMSYVAFYFVQSFTLGKLPWSTCDNWWNTPDCLNYNNDTLLGLYNDYKGFQLSGYNLSHPGAEHREIFGNHTYRSPADEYFHHRVLQISSGLDEPGKILWELAACHVLLWIITILCMIKGVKSVGKVVLFTATFPYVMLAILLVRGLTLPGAWKGIAFYILPDFGRLADPKVWCDAAFQVFFSTGPGWGGMITISSYNRFENNCYKDGVLVPIIMGLTSFFAGFVVFSTVGFMSEVVGRPVGEVVEQGPGLAFIMYPEVVTKLPLSQLWSILFFFMLFTVGLDSMFVMIETSVTAIWDELPPKYRIKRHWILIIMGIFMCIAGLPCITEGGMYLFQLMDTYGATYTVISVCILEVLAVAWIYGAERFLDDVKFMIGFHPSVMLWTIQWRIITTAITIGILVVAIVQYSPLDTYNGYQYPSWALSIGWGLCLVSLLWIPGWALGWILFTPGTITQKLRRCLVADERWGPASETRKARWMTHRREKAYGKNLLYRLKHPDY